MTQDHYPEAINLPEGVNMLLLAEDHQSDCPTCHQQTILRPITLTKASLRPLYAMRKRPEGMTPKQISDTLGRTAYANYTNLKYWGFIEPVDIPHANNILVSGWRVTKIGADFLDGIIRVPDSLWVYNDRVRVVPEDMRGRLATFEELTGYKEMSHEIAASESVALEANNTSSML